MDLDDMTGLYHDQAKESEEAFEHYTGTHGINPAVFAKHRLGWVVEAAIPEHEQWEGLPVVPYLTAGGLPVALRASPFVTDENGRFDLGYIEHRFPLAAPKLRIYNVGNSLPGLRTNRVHMVEKVLDVLQLRTEGERAVAIPGFQNFHPWWIELFSHSEVVIHHSGTKPDAVAGVTEMLRKRRITFTEQVERTPTVVEEG